MAFKIKFWGARGSIACPGPRHLAFGGNTSCVEVAMGGERVILDAGTGIRNLGHFLLKKDVKEATLLMSHTHWDHINGFPFFTPAFRPDYEFRVYAGHLPDVGIAHAFSEQMTHPFFPVPIEIMSANISFTDIKQGDEFFLTPEIKVKTIPLNHPDGATAYRLEFKGRSLCYVTDTEHTPGKLDETILGFIEGADLMIYDCTYTDEEFPSKVGWGHSTWQEGVRLCQAANVNRLAIFHHDPDHEDDFMERLEDEAFNTWQRATVVRENMRINLL